RIERARNEPRTRIRKAGDLVRPLPELRRAGQLLGSIFPFRAAADRRKGGRQRGGKLRSGYGGRIGQVADRSQRRPEPVEQVPERFSVPLAQWSHRPPRPPLEIVGKRLPHPLQPWQRSLTSQ